MIAALLPLVFSPVARLVGIALLAVSVLTSAYVKGRVDEHKVMYAHEQAELVKQKKEADDAIAAANAARAAAEKKFDHGRFNNRPGVLPGRVRHGSDGFARD